MHRLHTYILDNYNLIYPQYQCFHGNNYYYQHEWYTSKESQTNVDEDIYMKAHPWNAEALTQQLQDSISTVSVNGNDGGTVAKGGLLAVLVNVQVKGKNVMG